MKQFTVVLSEENIDTLHQLIDMELPEHENDLDPDEQEAVRRMEDAKEALKNAQPTNL